MSDHAPSTSQSGVPGRSDAATARSDAASASDAAPASDAATVTDDVAPEDDATTRDQIFAEEQAHLSATHATIAAIHESLVRKLEAANSNVREDLADLSAEVRIDFGGVDETMETLAAIETLNSVIDAYNLRHDITVETIANSLLLLKQPYFAKIRVTMAPGKPPKDMYIGAVGITDERHRPIVIDWRSPIASTYYSQRMGTVSYEVNGRSRTVELTLRRQFDIQGDRLLNYFDTSVAIEDALLLDALKRRRNARLEAITATIQREQNLVIRHDDVPVLLVNGIAGSGKTSVMLQRIAYLLYQQRETLTSDQVYLFTPNDVFGNYISTVLPQMGETNPHTLTWRSFMQGVGLGDRGDGRDCDPGDLERIDRMLPSLVLEDDDVTGISHDGMLLLKPAQVFASTRSYARFGVGPRFAALVCDSLHEKLNRRLAQLSKREEIQEEVVSLDIEDQARIFGGIIAPDDEAETASLTRTYLDYRYGTAAHEKIDQLAWLRIDRLGMRMLDRDDLNATQALCLRMAIVGHGDRDARFVMVDEVQDYTEAQLMLLARYFKNAHFLLTGDENQAIFEGTAAYGRTRQIFLATHGQVDEERLLTSYRSSPEITDLFASLMDRDARMQLSSVRRPGVAPVVRELDEDRDRYLAELSQVVSEASSREELTAVVAADASRAQWIRRQLGDVVTLVRRGGSLPTEGTIVLDLAVAKGLEFDHVIIPDAQGRVYDGSALSRRRLYTAISRATQRVTILSQGAMTPLLADAMEGEPAGAPVGRRDA